jgi:hypothetical protein
MATFTTKPLSGITQTDAIGGGYYSGSTNSNFSAYGVAWNTSPFPTISNPHTNDGSGTGNTFNWSSTLTGLQPDTLYYVRAYVTNNSGGTAYAGGTITGKTTSTVIHLTTLALSGVTNTTAISGGKVTGITGGTVTEVGIQIQKGVETGRTTIVGTYDDINVPFIIPITGLLPNTSYYVAAYAITLPNITNLAFSETLTTAPNAPQIGSITQPVSPNETGNVSFINIPDGADTIRWSGTATGLTTTAGGTSFTVTGLTIGTYFFSIKGDLPNQNYSPTTTVVIAASEIPEISSIGYKLFERTGIGDGPAEVAFNAEFAVIDHQIFVETNYTPEEIVQGNIK